MIFVAVKCRTLHNRPHVKPLNTYRLLLYVEEFHPVTNFMFKIAVQRGIGDITRRVKDKLKKELFGLICLINFVVKYKKVKLILI